MVAAMTDLAHVYLTAHGSYPAGSWVGESAQIGVRLAFAAVAAAPNKGDVFTPIANGAITSDTGTLAGTHGTLARTWTARINSVGSTENFDAAAQVDAAEDMWAFLNAIKAYQHSDFKWTHVKCSAVDPTGATPIVSSVYTFSSVLAGAVGTGLPPQVAMALSARANLVGRRGRGRVYIPALGTTILTTDGQINTTPANSMRSAFKTLIDNLQAQPGLTLNMPIFSIMSADSTTAVRPAEVRTGSRLDTMQSRRRQVTETYTATAL